MRIETLTCFHIGGKEFGSERAARAWLFDRIGETLDQQLSRAGKVIGPGDRLAMVEAIAARASDLAPILAAYVAPILAAYAAPVDSEE